VFEDVASNCRITGNSCGLAGGGACVATLNNCTIIGNSADLLGGGVYNCEVRNCIVYSNECSGTGANWDETSSVLYYSCTVPDPNTEGCITNVPLFVDGAAGNYRLQPGSPCVNAGTNSYVEGEADLDGYPRIVFGTVDMGAYEYVISTNNYDGDGVSNEEESVADTDATDPASMLVITDIAQTNSVRVVWVGGVRARQFLETRRDLLSVSEQWSTIYTNEPDTPVTNAYTHPAPADSAFYRIRAERP
jgi:hypothetical protein